MTLSTSEVTVSKTGAASKIKSEIKDVNVYETENEIKKEPKKQDQKVYEYDESYFSGQWNDIDTEKILGYDKEKTDIIEKTSEIQLEKDEKQQLTEPVEKIDTEETIIDEPVEDKDEELYLW